MPLITLLMLSLAVLDGGFDRRLRCLYAMVD